MSTITTINSSDLITNSRTVINTNFSNLNTDKIETSVLDTDTTLAANSDSKVATQKAVKAYVDTGGNVNASETTKGIVEEATDAELSAGTAAGATGAKLFTTPTKLQSSFYNPTRVLKAGATINGATLPVPVYQNKTDNEVYACDGNDTAALKFLGFAITNGTNGNDITVQFSGVVSGFSGLDEGEKYYLSDTAGTIQNTVGTYEVLVGIAISPTQLLIQKGRRYAKGNISGINSTSSSAITTGFRPSKVTIHARGASNAHIAGLDLEWLPAGLSYVCWLYNEGTGNTANITEAKVYDVTVAGNSIDYSITSVTDTGFTISWTEAGTVANDQVLVWSAEGEF